VLLTAKQEGVLLLMLGEIHDETKCGVCQRWLLGFSSIVGRPSLPNSALGPIGRNAAEQMAVIEGKTL
jgi:hypothetical protein